MCEERKTCPRSLTTGWWPGLCLIAEPTLSSAARSPLATAGTWNMADAVIMKTVSCAGTVVGSCCAVGIAVAHPGGAFLLGNPRVSQISYHTKPGLLFQALARLLLSLRTFWGTISEFKVALYPLLPPSSHAVCIWGPAKLVGFESKTVALSYCLPCCSPWYLEFLLKIIEAKKLLCSRCL